MKTNTLLFIIVTILIAVGILMVFSSSSIYAQEKHKDSLFFLKKQLLWAVTGLMFLFLALQCDYGIFQKWSILLLFISLALLVLVLFPQFSRVSGGAQRWLCLGKLSFQPGELAKFALVFYLADFCSRKDRILRKFSFSTLVPFVIVALIFTLLMFQPDFGTGIIIIVIAGIILFLAGMRFKYLLTVLLLVVPLVIMLVLFVPYIRDRLVKFLNPELSYHARQSLIALGSGGLKGVGLGKSSQKLFFLPAAQTDFIFSIIGEETGFIGGAFVILLYLGLLICVFRIAVRAPDKFGYLLSLGIGILLILQVIINLGVVMNLLPITGTPLPFISVGGSALFFNLLAVGIVLSVAKQGQG